MFHGLGPPTCSDSETVNTFIHFGRTWTGNLAHHKPRPLYLHRTKCGHTSMP